MQLGVFDHVDASGLALAEHYQTRLRLVEAMDRLGFRSYHMAEHHGTPLGLSPSPSVYLAAVSQRTKTLRFGPLVYIAPLYHPMRLAEEICMLDQLSLGRLELGLGRGAVWLEQELYGIDPKSAPERFDEARELVLKALEAPRVDFDGAYVKVPDFPMVVTPYQKPRPPLWYGISSVGTAPWCAENSVNAITLNPPAAAAPIFARYREEWERLGRKAGDLPLIGLSRHVVVAETDAAAVKLAKAAYAAWRTSMSHIWDARGVAFPIAMVYPREWEGVEQNGMVIAGSPETVRARMAEQIAEAGATYFLCQAVFGDLAEADALRSLELLARDVAPKLP
jgi:alkanesulfonate monooxygenase SsuD/methylene tetrahydromethanopterin reductase-like flavin-dependent oxidoreductase (luciferase family)